MGRRPKPSTLVRIYKHDRQKLQFCSVALAKDQILILNELISELYRVVFPLFAQSVQEKRPIKVFVDIKAIIPDSSFITGSRQISMSKTNKQLDKEMIRHVEKEYAKREGK